jgi:Xaa-Pro aminopeptidase
MSEQLFIQHFENTSVDSLSILKAQKIAIDCLEYLKTILRPGLSYDEIHQICYDRMKEKGADGFWTHDDPALILYGDLSCYSAHEGPASLFRNVSVKENDFITVDVAPMVNKGWGDLARSFVMEKGKIIPYEESENKEIRDGLNFELYLHNRFKSFVDENTTFGMLHDYVEKLLEDNDYINLDYHGNFGHTIETDPKDRVTIINDEDRIISEYNKPLTFEPHICKKNGSYGIKHENMYFFHEGKMIEVR